MGVDADAASSGGCSDASRSSTCNGCPFNAANTPAGIDHRSSNANHDASCGADAKSATNNAPANSRESKCAEFNHARDTGNHSAHDTGYGSTGDALRKCANRRVGRIAIGEFVGQQYEPILKHNNNYNGARNKCGGAGKSKYESGRRGNSFVDNWNSTLDAVSPGDGSGESTESAESIRTANVSEAARTRLPFSLGAAASCFEDWPTSSRAGNRGRELMQR